MNNGNEIFPSLSCPHIAFLMHLNSWNLTPDHLILSARHLSLIRIQKNFSSTSGSITHCLTDPVLRFTQIARLYMNRRVINNVLLALVMPGILRKLNLTNLSVNFKRWLHSLKNSLQKIPGILNDRTWNEYMSNGFWPCSAKATCCRINNIILKQTI